MSQAARTVDITDATGRLTQADLDWLTQMAGRALEVQNLTGALSARIVADAEMAAAHAEFCGVEGTTDVITFDLTDPEDNAPAKRIVEADLILCLDEADRQAKARGHEARRELLLYIIHGVLHCLGHDDHEETTYAKMHAEEDRLLTLLGVGATFNRDTAARGGA
ncbi:MAG: rRNA maturation RNase YbeY [Phycisphaerales bacterium]